MNAQVQRLQLVLLPGRYIGGDHTKKQTMREGKPIPEDKQQFSIGVAIRKDAPGLQEMLGKIWQYVAGVYGQNPSVAPRLQRGFVNSKQGGISWKISDGDMPDDKGQKKANAEGCFVFWCSSSFPIKVCDRNNAEMDPAMLKRGYYVDVAVSIAPNGEQGDRAGIYINPNFIRMLAFGDEIFSGMSADQAFGAAPAPSYLPPGASAAPTAPAMPGMMPGMQPQAMPGFTPPNAGGFPSPAPNFGTPGSVPGFVPNAAGQPMPTGFAMTPPPSTAYPSSQPPAMPGVPPQGQAMPGFSTPQHFGNPSPMTGFPGNGAPINPQTGQPVQPYPQFMQTPPGR